MSQVTARYREFAPAPELAGYVRALFTFRVGPREEPATPARAPIRDVVFREGDPFWSTLFADAHVSIVANLGDGYRVDGLWEPPRATPHVIGAMPGFRPTRYGTGLVQMGAYLRPGAARRVTGVAPGELTARIVPLDAVWGGGAAELQDRLAEATTAERQIEALERGLLRSLCPEAPVSAYAARLAAAAMRRTGWTVQELAGAAGLSRQHLTRMFRENTGVTPKLYLRLARFQRALRYAGRERHADWARAAAELGYADQSHLIAEFKQFSGLTPEAFSSGRWFHPFQGRTL